MPTTNKIITVFCANKTGVDLSSISGSNERQHSSGYGVEVADLNNRDSVFATVKGSYGVNDGWKGEQYGYNTVDAAKMCPFPTQNSRYLTTRRKPTSMIIYKRVDSVLDIINSMSNSKHPWEGELWRNPLCGIALLNPYKYIAYWRIISQSLEQVLALVGKQDPSVLLDRAF
ncbi:hypothetical protein C8J56DRAFT_898993 [Mycena floridula]|nr:hypothetical protein C8J56DRAFT_898993 [Mycena floridula]